MTNRDKKIYEETGMTKMEIDINESIHRFIDLMVEVKEKGAWYKIKDFELYLRNCEGIDPMDYGLKWETAGIDNEGYCIIKVLV